MSSRVECVGTGVAALLCVCAVGVRPAAATPVTVHSLDWQFYQGGYAQQDDNNFDFAQESMFNVPSRTVSLTIGGATFNSIASIQHTTLNDDVSFSFSTVATLRAEASVDAGSPMGAADAFAGLSLLAVVFEVSGAPSMYVGDEPLESPNGQIFSGDVIQPGMYEFFYSRPLVLDAQTWAGPGESTFDEVTRSFNFEFVVPAPGAALLAAPTVVMLARRRRR